MLLHENIDMAMAPCAVHKSHTQRQAYLAIMLCNTQQSHIVQQLTCPDSSADLPAKAPGVSTNVTMGRPNLSACFMKRNAFL